MNIHNQDANKARKGFTLIELLIVTMCISVLIVPFIYLEVQSSERVSSNIFRQQLTENGARAQEWIARDIRSASAILEQWQDQALAPDRLILAGADKSVIVYSFDKKQGVITRSRYSGEKKNAEPVVMEMARQVEDLKFEPVDPGARIINVYISLARELLNSRETIALDGIVARRTSP